MEPILYRLLVGCLVVWLIDKALEVFRVGEPAKWAVQLIALIVAVLWIVFGWMVVLK